MSDGSQVFAVGYLFCFYLSSICTFPTVFQKFEGWKADRTKFKENFGKAVHYLKNLSTLIYTAYVLPGKNTKRKLQEKYETSHCEAVRPSVLFQGSSCMQEVACTVAEMVLIWGSVWKNVACSLKIPWFITALKIKPN